jgi:hypothetical protein
MINHFYSNTPELETLVKNDPVRPHIPIHMRFGDNRAISVFGCIDDPGAAVCYSILDSVPKSEEDLFTSVSLAPNVACLYTIWSIKRGDARKLVFEMLRYLRDEKGVKRVVTLSPSTDMARRFHMNNGAFIFRVNESEDTVNYEYTV